MSDLHTICHLKYLATTIGHMSPQIWPSWESPKFGGQTSLCRQNSGQGTRGEFFFAWSEAQIHLTKSHWVFWYIHDPPRILLAKTSQGGPNRPPHGPDRVKQRNVNNVKVTRTSTPSQRSLIVMLSNYWIQSIGSNSRIQLSAWLSIPVQFSDPRLYGWSIELDVNWKQVRH